MHETHERTHGLLAQQIGNIQAFDNFGHSGKPQFLPDARGQVLPGSLLPGLFRKELFRIGVRHLHELHPLAPLGHAEGDRAFPQAGKAFGVNYSKAKLEGLAIFSKIILLLIYKYLLRLQVLLLFRFYKS